MTRLKTHELSLQQLETRIVNMKGEDKVYLQAHLDMLKALDDTDFKGVMNLYNGLMKINGMSEITAFSTVIKIAQKAARL